jgi:hypothetical protein
MGTINDVWAEPGSPGGADFDGITTKKHILRSEFLSQYCLNGEDFVRESLNFDAWNML